jgi:hypothetical protein
LRQSALGIIRAKGFVTDVGGARALIQMVGRAVDVTYPDTDAQPGIVFIGLKGQLDEAAIRAMLATFEIAAV